MRFQVEMVRVQQEYESLALIVSQALGGNKQESAKAVQTYDELAAAISSMGGKVGG